MTIILFLVDTSASMSQKAHVNGVQKSYLDIAKGAVETFLKYRQRSVDCMGDRYMLLTFEDPPCNVKAGWKENHATFMNELKNLQSNGLTSMGEGLKNAFDLLNLNRMQSGIDTYGQGRCPFYLETSVIIVLTDGGKYSYRNGVHPEIILPLHAQIPGTKLTKEPFRWDQRLFSLVLRIPGNKPEERYDGKVPHDESPIEKMCEVTGGRSYRIKSHNILTNCIESLVQKVQPGVVVHFEQLLTKDLKDGEVQDIVFQTTKRMIYVQKHPAQKAFPVGFWPIPEPFWPDPKALNLPPRDAHPKIRVITPCIEEPQLIRNFPFDKYELEGSPLTLQIIAKREANKCWPVSVSNGMHGLDMPFGYIKANITFTQVFLMVLPYNYPILLPLLIELFQKYNLNPPNDWLYKFQQYVRSIPQYYCPFLRRALVSANVPYQLLQYILPENLDSYLSPNLANHFKQMKNTAKQDQDNLCLRVFKQLKLPKPNYHQVEASKLNCGQPLKRDVVTHPMLRDLFNKLHSEINIYDNYTIVVPTVFNSVAAKNYRNPYDIPRKDLIDEIARMRENFFKLPTCGVNLYTKDAGHSLPISEMGNYQEYLKNKEVPLREIEPTNVRQHMFGNPYKKDKHMVMVDEADLGDVAPVKPNAANTPKKLELGKMSRKRKAGPIRKDYIYRRTSMSSSPSSIDSDDDNESMSSYDSENRLEIDFDEPVNDEFSINGHVQSFINGDSDDVDDSAQPGKAPEDPSVLRIVGPAAYNFPVYPTEEPPEMINYLLETKAINTPQPPPTLPPVLPAEANAATSAHPLVTILVPPSLTSSTPAFSLPLSPVTVTALAQHNDISDAQEISKILQQCHIPQNSNTNINTIHNNNNNNNNNNDNNDNIIIINNNTNSNDNNINNNNGNSSNNKDSETDIDEHKNSNHINIINNNNNISSSSISSSTSSSSCNNTTNNNYSTNNDGNNNNNNISINVDNDNDNNDNNNINNINDNNNNEHNNNNNNNNSSNYNITINNNNEISNNIMNSNCIIENNHNNHDEKENIDSLQTIDYNIKIEYNNDNNNHQINNKDHNLDKLEMEEEMNEDQKENIKQHNLEARTTIFKDIRRPGRDYSDLLEHLGMIQGNFETKFNFIQMCINESLRFRRKKMADLIQEWWENQIDALSIAPTVSAPTMTNHNHCNTTVMDL